MTTVPAAQDALVSAVKSAAGPRVDVEYGPWMERPAAEDVIVIGWRPDEGNTVDFDEVDAGLASSQEDYEVVGLVSSWNGNGDIRAAVNRSDELMEMIRTVLTEDRTLGGVVERARLRARSFSPYRTTQGAESAVEFTVQIRAHRIPD